MKNVFSWIWLFIKSIFTSKSKDSSDLPHFRQVRPNVIASGQPTPTGFHKLKEMFPGRKITVVKLNFPTEGSDDEARNIGITVLDCGIMPRTGFKGVIQVAEDEFKMPDPKVWATVIQEILKIPAVDDGEGLWLFHCVNGNDRTNLAIGHVRRLVDKWTKEQALKEMVTQGYHWELVGLDRKWAELA